jgi:hypothetical protein
VFTQLAGAEQRQVIWRQRYTNGAVNTAAAIWAIQ